MSAHGKAPFVKTILDDIQNADRSSKLELVTRIWPDSGLAAHEFQEDEYNSFMGYIDRQIMSLRAQRSKFASETMEGTISLIDILRNNFDRPQEWVLQRITERFRDADEAAAARTLELMIRIWLTVEVRSSHVARPSHPANTGAIEWPLYLSLREVLYSEFLPPSTGDRSKSLRTAGLDPSFTAVALVNICSITLDWTQNLANHLKLDKRRLVLSVYEHKICLVNHSKDVNSPIPHPTLQEAIDTLNLLFPFGHAPTRQLLQREKRMPLYRLGICKRTRVQALKEYPIWGRRLAELVELFDEPPRSWWQLFIDRRNLKDWVAFWIGIILLLVLTLVGIITGAISSIYTVKQYNLTLAQACSEDGAFEKLSQYCR